MRPQIFKDLWRTVLLSYVMRCVLSETFCGHIEHLCKVLRRLEGYGVKLKTGTCALFKREVTFLGRVISQGRYRIDPKDN